MVCVMATYAHFFIALAPILSAVACDDPPKPAPTKPSATVPAVAPALASAAQNDDKPKEVKKAKPKKTAADCPKGPKVAFDDQAVEDEVRKKLGKEGGDVTQADLGKLKSLNLSQIKMDELDVCVIPHAKNLKELFIGPGETDDLAPIAGLTQLESLRASINKVADLRPLEKLTKLDRLDLGRTQVTDLGPLSALGSLTELAVDDTPVRDLSPLAKLEKLQRLSIQRTQVKDFGPLKDLNNLKFLYIAGTPATDTSMLQPLRAKGLKIFDQ